MHARPGPGSDQQPWASLWGESCCLPLPGEGTGLRANAADGRDQHSVQSSLAGAVGLTFSKRAAGPAQNLVARSELGKGKGLC